MKKVLLSLLMVVATICAMAGTTVQVNNTTDLKAALKNPAVTTVLLTADMPSDENIGEYCYDASNRNLVGKKILDLNGHEVWASAYMMYYTLSTDTLVITGNGTWNCDSPYGFDLGDSEVESATAGVLIIESGTFNYSDSYAFFAFGWSSGDYLPQAQVVINGGTFILDNKSGNFIYSGSTTLGTGGKKPKITFNGGEFNIKCNMFRISATDVVTVNGGSFLYTGPYAGAFESENTKLGTGKVAYIGGQAFTGTTLDYTPMESTLPDIDYYTTFQVGNGAEDFVEVNANSSSDGKAGLEVATNMSYYPSSGKFLKNTPFKMKALAMPSGDKKFNGWGSVKGTKLSSLSEKEVEFSVGTKDIEMKAFFGSNMPTDFIQGNIHYFITYGNEVKVGSGNVESSDGLTPEELFNGNIVIPVSVTYNSNTYYVTSIADYAFYGRTDIWSVDCASGSKLQSVGAWACAGCTRLSSAWFEEAKDCSSYGEGAFSGCTKLTTFWLDNDMIYEIPAHFFENCTSLMGITNWGSWSSLNSIGAYAFAGCTSLMNYDGSLWLEDAMMSYGDYAFANCKSFTNFTVPQYVNMLGSHVFDGCPLEWIKVPNPNAIGVFNDTSFPNGSTVCVPCDEYSTLMDPTWQTPKWNVIGYNPVLMTLSTQGMEDNEHYMDGYGSVTQLTNCSNITTVNATATDGNRFYRWQYSNGMTSTYNYDNPASYTYSSEATITAEFLSPHQVLVDVKYVTEDGSALPSGFGGVTLYLNKKGGTETAYTGGPTVWRKCEKYDEMDVDPSYINMTAKVGNVNDYRYEFVKWNNNNATTQSITVPVDRDTVLIAVIKELPKYTCSVSADPTAGGNVTLVFGDIVTEKEEYQGQNVKFYASPATGWSFSHWDDDLTKTTETLEIIGLSKNETHVAHFKKEVILTYGPQTSGTGTVAANSGTSGSKYWSGTKVTLTATPATNYEFVKWADDNSTNPVREITIGYADASYTAIFQQIMCNVNVTVVPTGSAAVTGGGEYAMGSTANLSYTAEEGYEFVSWQREGATAVTTNTIAITVDQKTINVILTMKKIVKYKLKLDIESTVNQGLSKTVLFGQTDFYVADGVGEFTYYDSSDMLVMEGEYSPGTEISIKDFNPHGFVFDHWKDNNSTTFERTITMDKDITLTMVVRPVTYTVSAVTNDATYGTATVTASSFTFADIVKGGLESWKASYSATATPGYKFLCWMSPSLYAEIIGGESEWKTPAEFAATIKKEYDVLDAKGAAGRDEEEEDFYQLCKFLLSPSGEVGFQMIGTGDAAVDINQTTGAITTMACFVEADKVSLSVTCDPEQGSVETNKAEYAIGEVAKLTATAKDGYEFDHWSTGETTASIYVDVTVENVAKTYTAYFREAGTTGLDNVGAATRQRKYMENGVLFIERNGRLYNAQGKLVK